MQVFYNFFVISPLWDRVKKQGVIFRENIAKGCIGKWICCKTDAVYAKEFTILPGKSVLIKDAAIYCLIMMQRHGTLNGMKLEIPVLIRYGQLSNDGYFVFEKAAQRGVLVVDESDSDPIVMLKHFGHADPQWGEKFM